MLRSKPVPVVSSLGAAIFGIVIALGAALLVIPIFPESEDLVVGNIVKRDLVSQYDISYVSDKLTEAEEEKAAAAGLCGIAVEAGRALVIDRKKVISLENKHKLFLLGITQNGP